MTSFSTDTGESFDKRFDVYREKSQEKFKDIEILQSHLPSVVSKVLKETCQDKLNILSIGSGTGEIDYEILKMIEADQKNASYSQVKILNRAVEPNEHYIGVYEASIGDFVKSLGSQISFDLVKNTFEGYMKTKGDPVRFDIIHFVRSIYYVDAEETLLECFEKELNENGRIALVLAGSGDLIIHLHRMLWPTGKPLDSEPFELQDEKGIVKIADKHGWKHEVFSLNYSLDVTEILDEKSIKGNLLLDFLTHKMNYRLNADKKELESVLEFIRKEAVFKDGKYLGTKSSNIIFLYK